MSSTIIVQNCHCDIISQDKRTWQLTRCRGTFVMGGHGPIQSYDLGSRYGYMWLNFAFSSWKSQWKYYEA